jgi:hypothetical protein
LRLSRPITASDRISERSPRGRPFFLRSASDCLWGRDWGFRDRNRPRNPAEIEQTIRIFVQEPNGALIVTPNAVSLRHRDLFIALAARHRLPAVYPYLSSPVPAASFRTGSICRTSIDGRRRTSIASSRARSLAIVHCTCRHDLMRNPLLQRYWGQSGRALLHCICPLLTQSGHSI